MERDELDAAAAEFERGPALPRPAVIDLDMEETKEPAQGNGGAG